MKPTLDLITIVIALGALAISLYSAHAARKSGQVSELLSLWQRYEQYAADLSALSDTTNPDDARRVFLNMANFIENLCFIYNRKFSTRPISENIEALVSDYIVLTNSQMIGLGANYQDVLRGLGLGEDAYSETHAFIAKKKRLIARKSFQVPESAYRDLTKKDLDGQRHEDSGPPHS